MERPSPTPRTAAGWSSSSTRPPWIEGGAAPETHAARRYTQQSPLLYLDDLQVGQRFTSGTHALDEAQIKAFAGQFDPQPFHLDDEAAQSTLFAGLSASGWHTAAITMRLLVEGGAPVADGIIGAGGELIWPRPARPGDLLHVESEVIEVKPSRSRPDRGMVTLRSETRNQHGDVVQVFVSKLVVPRRHRLRLQRLHHQRHPVPVRRHNHPLRRALAPPAP